MMNSTAEKYYPSQQTHAALLRCVVIEFDSVARQTIVRGIKAANLFQHICVPTSVSQALKILNNRECDICVLGPTFNGEDCVTFLKSAHAMRLGRRTAFIQLERDYAKTELAQRIIAGVLEANQRQQYREACSTGFAEERHDHSVTFHPPHSAVFGGSAQPPVSVRKTGNDTATPRSIRRRQLRK